MKQLTVALVQHSCSRDKSHNIEKSMAGIREAAGNGAKLVVLQELHLSPYFCQTESQDYFDLAESIPGPSTESLAALAKELGVVVVASVFERRAAGLYHNTAVVLEKDGSLAGMYRKMHIPDDPGYYEKYYFAPGDLGFNPIASSVGNLGVLVCWDQWYPEAARLMTLAGADLLIYPTAIGWGSDETEHEKKLMLDAWITIQRSHSVANGVPTICTNRVGFEPTPGQPGRGQLFWGNSFVAGPQGELLAVAGSESDEVLNVDIDLERTELVRRNWPFLRDRRIDFYQDLLRRFRD